MSEIAFIGDRDTIWVFQALGGEVFFSDEHESVPRLVSEVLQGEFKLIFVTEDVYDTTRETIDEQQEEAIPTFALIPSVKGSRGAAMQMIRESVRRAMGAEFI
jgi:V/A-type H+-transporting ATPase subunit F